MWLSETFVRRIDAARSIKAQTVNCRLSNRRCINWAKEQAQRQWFESVPTRGVVQRSIQAEHEAKELESKLVEFRRMLEGSKQARVERLDSVRESHAAAVSTLRCCWTAYHITCLFHDWGDFDFWADVTVVTNMWHSTSRNSVAHIAAKLITNFNMLFIDGVDVRRYSWQGDDSILKRYRGRTLTWEIFASANALLSVMLAVGSP